MAIIDLQRRNAEHGRIRLGVKAPTSNGRTRPAKLDKFRFTSSNLAHIEALAGLYGGTVKPWDNSGKAEHEVITEAARIRVLVIREGLSQWWETWSGGGCRRRCEGFGGTETNSDQPCLCASEIDAGATERQCKATTRLSVILPDLASLGVWRLETHGINAAMELPAISDLAQVVGEMVPAWLSLQERVSKRDGKTSRFVVPVLDLEVTTARLAQIAAQSSGMAPAAVTGAPSAAAIGAGPAADPADTTDWAGMVADATTSEELRGIWAAAGQAGALEVWLREAITARAATLDAPTATLDAPTTAPATPATPAPAADTGPLYAAIDTQPADADIITDSADDEDAAMSTWDLIMTAAGERGMTLDALNADFTKVIGCDPPAATLAQLRTYHAALTAAKAV